MDRIELLSSPEYWMTKIQNELFSQIEEYLEKEGINKSQLAKRLGVSKGYISQVLNGDFDHRISKLVKMSLDIGMVPKVGWTSLESILSEDANQTPVVSIAFLTKTEAIGLKGVRSGDYQRTKTIVLPMSNDNISEPYENKVV